MKLVFRALLCLCALFSTLEGAGLGQKEKKLINEKEHALTIENAQVTYQREIGNERKTLLVERNSFRSLQDGAPSTAPLGDDGSDDGADDGEGGDDGADDGADDVADDVDDGADDGADDTGAGGDDGADDGADDVADDVDDGADDGADDTGA